jgi:hypothetical protein
MSECDELSTNILARSVRDKLQTKKLIINNFGLLRYKERVTITVTPRTMYVDVRMNEEEYYFDEWILIVATQANSVTLKEILG